MDVKIKVISALVICLFFCSSNAFAENFRIETVDGNIFVGEIVSFQNNVYTINTNFGKLTVESLKVKSLQPAASAGAAPSAYNEPGPASSPVHLRALRLHGSNTIGDELAPRLIEGFVRQSRGNLGQWSTTAPEERLVDVIEGPAELPGRFELHAHGSGTAFKDLAQGGADIGNASRPINDAEIALLATKGDMTAPPAENVIGLDAVVILIHPTNAVTRLTVKQIADIFSGRIRNWRDVGGDDAPIKLLARDNNSGTYDTFKNLVLGAEALDASAQRFESSDELSERVSSDPQAIGFTGLAYIRNAKPVTLDECGTAYAASAFSVKTEEYPLSRRLFMYRLPNDASETTTSFIKFAQSTAGQTIVSRSGFVDLGIETADHATVLARRNRIVKERADGPRVDPRLRGPLKQFEDITRDAARLSVTFRFLKGRTDLDSRASEDIGLLIQFLKEPKNAGRRVYVIGFASATGAPEVNWTLSRNRAAAIAKRLADAGGSQVASFGVGPNLEIACDDRPRGVFANQRVEVWLEER